ncbi:unnamed protein product [Amoebophrya sp. A25]|nr:unnamed protein product [Amoebophrya sp. A25]|eukprot:GSA25T00009980001.1
MQAAYSCVFLVGFASSYLDCAHASSPLLTAEPLSGHSRRSRSRDLEDVDADVSLSSSSDEVGDASDEESSSSDSDEDSRSGGGGSGLAFLVGISCRATQRLVNSASQAVNSASGLQVYDTSSSSSTSSNTDGGRHHRPVGSDHGLVFSALNHPPPSGEAVPMDVDLEAGDRSEHIGNESLDVLVLPVDATAASSSTISEDSAPQISTVQACEVPTQFKLESGGEMECFICMRRWEVLDRKGRRERRRAARSSILARERAERRNAMKEKLLCSSKDGLLRSGPVAGIQDAPSRLRVEGSKGTGLRMPRNRGVLAMAPEQVQLPPSCSASMNGLRGDNLVLDCSSGSLVSIGGFTYASSSDPISPALRLALVDEEPASAEYAVKDAGDEATTTPEHPNPRGPAGSSARLTDEILCSRRRQWRAEVGRLKSEEPWVEYRRCRHRVCGECFTQFHLRGMSFSGKCPFCNQGSRTGLEQTNQEEDVAAHLLFLDGTTPEDVVTSQTPRGQRRGSFDIPHILARRGVLARGRRRHSRPRLNVNALISLERWRQIDTGARCCGDCCLRLVGTIVSTYFASWCAYHILHLDRGSKNPLGYY